MAGTGKKWLIGCGVGCAAFMLIGIVLTVGGGFLMMRPFNQAVDQQAELIEIYGHRQDYVPSPDGITRDRLKSFLAVRASLEDYCDRFDEIAQSFREMEKLDTADEEPPMGDILKGVGNVMGSAFSMAGEIGNFTAQRNTALLAHEMGMGEYTWIYVLTYNSWLGYEPNTGFEGDQSEGFSDRESRVIKQLMLNHAEALEKVGRQEEAKIWRDEAGRLSRSEGRVPFASGNLPSEISSALIPYRTRLEGAYCPAMSQFDLNQVKKRGLSIQSY